MAATSSGVALTSGALAGLSVDLALYPLDTLKTRLQSAQGFRKAGGFRAIYSGLGSVAVGSMPGAALFFCSYETVKHHWGPGASHAHSAVGYMVAASVAEVIGCLVWVPVEVIKQRSQATPKLSSLVSFKRTITAEGFGGLYRGFLSTVLREVPLCMLQFPMWEYMKQIWAIYQQSPIKAWQSAVCGAASGAVAGAVTTPLDVAKTRIMLADTGTRLAKGSIGYALQLVWKEKGFPGLFAGIMPRILWISAGGAIFLGVYDQGLILMTR